MSETLRNVQELARQALMSEKTVKKLVHEGPYLAEVEVRLIESDDPWAPYLSVEDARTLDEVRLALRRGALSEAARLASVYRLTPVHAA